MPGGHVKNGIMAFVNGGSVPKFSKYVGVQEWANCVLLMFNLSASSKGQTYTNSFVGQPGGGMHVTYYLSDRSIILPPFVSCICLIRSGHLDMLLNECVRFSLVWSWFGSF